VVTFEFLSFLSRHSPSGLPLDRILA